MVETQTPLLRAAVRRAVLAVCVLDDLELRMTGTGVQVGDNVVVPWAHLTSTFTQEGRADLAALTDPDIDSGAARSARLRLSAHLHLAPMLANREARDEIRLHTRLLALPSDHILHPGPSWVRQPVLGGAVETGLGVVDLVPGRDDIVPLPAPLTDDLEAADWWTRVVAHAHRMGELVVQRLTRDTDFGRASMWINPESGALPSGVLRPVGGVDVVSLLATPALRQHLAGSDSSGMRAVAVPMRDRGWYDLTHTDPAFIGAAWAATDEVNRGLRRAVLVTADEVGLGSAPAGAPAIDLREPSNLATRRHA